MPDRQCEQNTVVVERAPFEKLRADSIVLNSVTYAVAEALGRVADGEDYIGDPEALVGDLLAEHDAWRLVVDAARAVAYLWPPPANLPRAVSMAGNELAVAVARLDDPARAPLSHAETVSTPGESPSEGKPSQSAPGASGAVDSFAEALRRLVAANGPLTFLDPRPRPEIKRLTRKLRKAHRRLKQHDADLDAAQADIARLKDWVKATALMPARANAMATGRPKPPRGAVG